MQTRRFKPVTELYARYYGLRQICIIGAAPCVREDMEQVPIPGDDCVIVLNSSFLVYPEYNTIHWVANREFLELYSGKLTKRRICITPHSFEKLDYEEQFGYFPSVAVGKEKARLMAEDESIMTGHSCLIPALHFALRCRPKRVLLYGVDMNEGFHWDDGINKNVSGKRFPAWRIVCKELAHLTSMFDSIKVFSVNRSSAPAMRRSVLPLEVRE